MVFMKKNYYNFVMKIRGCYEDFYEKVIIIQAFVMQ